MTANKALTVASEDRRAFYRVSGANGDDYAAKTFDLINFANPEAECELVGMFSDGHASIDAFPAISRAQGWSTAL